MAKYLSCKLLERILKTNNLNGKESKYILWIQEGNELTIIDLGISLSTIDVHQKQKVAKTSIINKYSLNAKKFN